MERSSRNLDHDASVKAPVHTELDVNSTRYEQLITILPSGTVIVGAHPSASNSSTCSDFTILLEEFLLEVPSLRLRP